MDFPFVDGVRSSLIMLGGTDGDGGSVVAIEEEGIGDSMILRDEEPVRPKMFSFFHLTI